jgi:bifunctional non-homologous end joining protein LigD
MAWRDGERVRLFTRNGHDWRARFPLIVAATIALKVRSCLIDGEAVCCDENGLAVFQELRRRQRDDRVFLYAFDLLELNGADLRREPIEARKTALASCCGGRGQACA